MKTIDITNRAFGDLTVSYRHGSNSDKKSTWLCTCVCGNTVVKSRKALIRSVYHSLNCGLSHPNKICSICKKDKPKSEYHKCLNNKNGISAKCKECTSDFYIENKEIIKEKYNLDMLNPELRNKKVMTNKKSRIKNKITQAKYKYEYTRREEVKERRKEIHNIRKKKDINYVIKRRLRGRVRDIVKAMSRKHKYKSSLVLLGCDMEFFKKYIENKFNDGMCWDRISEIHIDHIKPCDSFDLTKLEEQEKCFHYTNLQPLWWMDNLSKGKSYPF